MGDGNALDIGEVMMDVMVDHTRLDLVKIKPWHREKESDTQQMCFLIAAVRDMEILILAPQGVPILQGAKRARVNQAARRLVLEAGNAASTRYLINFCAIQQSAVPRFTDQRVLLVYRQNQYHQPLCFQVQTILRGIWTQEFLWT